MRQQGDNVMVKLVLVQAPMFIQGPSTVIYFLSLSCINRCEKCGKQGPTWFWYDAEMV